MFYPVKCNFSKVLNSCSLESMKSLEFEVKYLPAVWIWFPHCKWGIIIPISLDSCDDINEDPKT